MRTWLFGILLRKVMEMRRAIGRDRETDDIDDIVESRFDANGSWIRPPQAADAELYARQVREGIDDCLETAPPKQRMAFVLREVEEMTTTEICKILEVTDTNFVSTVSATGWASASRRKESGVDRNTSL